MAECMTTVEERQRLEGAGLAEERSSRTPADDLEDLMEEIRSRLIGMSAPKKRLALVELETSLAFHASVVKALLQIESESSRELALFEEDN